MLIMKRLTPRMNDEEIIDCISEHFDPLIQDARRVQNISNIRQFQALLQREDMKRNLSNSRFGPRELRKNNKIPKFTEMNPTNQPYYSKSAFNHQYTYRNTNQYTNQSYNKENSKTGVTHRQFGPQCNNVKERNYYQRPGSGNEIRNWAGPHRETNSYQEYQKRSEVGNNRNTQLQENKNQRSYPTQEQKAVCQIITENVEPPTTHEQIRKGNVQDQEDHPHYNEKRYLN